MKDSLLSEMLKSVYRVKIKNIYAWFLIVIQNFEIHCMYVNVTFTYMYILNIILTFPEPNIDIKKKNTFLSTLLCDP